MTPIREVNLSEFGIGASLAVTSAEKLLHRLRAIGADPDARVVLITGDPRAFCGGGTEAAVDEIVCRTPEAYAPFIQELVAFPLPVVLAMEGAAIGAGLGFALALGDFFVASLKSRYGVHFIRMGITPGMGISLLLRNRVGAPFANEMLFSGKLYRGAELLGHSQGATLFDRIVPGENVVSTATELAARFMHVSRLVLTEMKKLLRPLPGPLSEAMEREQQSFKTLAADSATQASIRGYFASLPHASKV